MFVFLLSLFLLPPLFVSLAMQLREMEASICISTSTMFLLSPFYITCTGTVWFINYITTLCEVLMRLIINYLFQYWLHEQLNVCCTMFR